MQSDRPGDARYLSLAELRALAESGRATTEEVRLMADELVSLHEARALCINGMRLHYELAEARGGEARTTARAMMGALAHIATARELYGKETR